MLRRCARGYALRRCIKATREGGCVEAARKGAHIEVAREGRRVKATHEGGHVEGALQEGGGGGAATLCRVPEEAGDGGSGNIMLRPGGVPRQGVSGVLSESVRLTDKRAEYGLVRMDNRTG